MEGSIVCAESTPEQLAEWDAIAGSSQPLTSPAAISVASPPSAGSEAAQPRGLMSHRSSTTGGVTMRHSVSFQEPLSCHQTGFAPFQALPPVSSHSMVVSSDAVCNRGSACMCIAQLPSPCMMLMYMLCQSTYNTSLSSLHILPVLSLGCVGKAFV